jgi:hypothetical protein
MKAFKSGDRVSWRTAGRIVRGQIKRILTDDIQIMRHVVHANEDNPRYLVKSDEGQLGFYSPDRLHKA